MYMAVFRYVKHQLYSYLCMQLFACQCAEVLPPPLQCSCCTVDHGMLQAAAFAVFNRSGHVHCVWQF